jgi:fatty acid desaturase
VRVAGLAGSFRDLGHLSRRQQLVNIGYLAGAWLLALTAIDVFWTWRSPVTLALAFVIVAARQQALLNIEHDCVHGNFLENNRANSFVGLWLSSAAVGSPYQVARARHLAHHRLVGTEGDPDAELHMGDDKRTRAGLIGYFLKSLLGAYALMVLVKKPADTSGTRTGTVNGRAHLVPLAVVQFALLLTLWALFDWWVYPALWLLPLGTLTAACHLLRNFGEHALTPDEEAVRGDRLITTVSNPVERFLVAPFHMNLHAEHHLFPWVPAPNLPALRDRLGTIEGAPSILIRPSYLRAFWLHLRAAL